MVTTFLIRKKTCFLATALAIAATTTMAADAEDPSPGIFERTKQHLSNIWENGQNEFYLPIYTYHLRSAYSQEQIDSYNEYPLGFGLGRGRYDEKGNWQGLYLMGFQDSHSKPEYMLGYGYKAYWPIIGELRAGLGYTIFLTTRSDIAHYVPIPGILPIASLEYKRLALDVSYLPGGKGNGNILFFSSKIRF